VQAQSNPKVRTVTIVVHTEPAARLRKPNRRRKGASGVKRVQARRWEVVA
jgi:hypothetical protein